MWLITCWCAFSTVTPLTNMTLRPQKMKKEKKKKKANWCGLLWKPHSERLRSQFESLCSSTCIVLQRLMQQVTYRCRKLNVVDKYLAEAGCKMGAKSSQPQVPQMFTKKTKVLQLKMHRVTGFQDCFFCPVDHYFAFFSLSVAGSFSCSVMIISFTRHYITCFSASVVGLISRLYE